MKYATLTAFLLIQAICAINLQAMPDPSAAYCVKLGYKSIVEKGPGGECGYCMLPNGIKAEAWAFFRGEIYKEYSYCAQKGYDLIIDTTTDEFGNNYTCPFCVKYDSLNALIEKIRMVDFMSLYGDTLIKHLPNGFDGMKVDSPVQSPDEDESVLPYKKNETYEAIRKSRILLDLCLTVMSIGFV